MDKKLIVSMLFLLPGLIGTTALGDLNSGLVAHWEFEGDFKDSAGTNDGTPKGDAKVVTDPERGQVLELDGTGDYVEVPNSPSLNIMGDRITLAAWVYHDDVSGNPEIIIAKVFNNTTHTSPYFSYGLHILTNGQPRIWLRLAGNVNAPGTTYLQSAKWHHLAGVYDGAQLRLYLDGILVATNASASGNITGYDNVLRLGINGGLTEPMDGKMDDVRIYNRALSEREVVSLATGASLEAAWNPDPADGATGVSSPLLQWGAGEAAVFHDVYFGTTPDLGPTDLVASRLFLTMYWHSPGFEPGATYCWRVDEVEVDGVTVHTGEVWSFTAEPLAAYAPQPADGAVNLFPSQTLSWRPGKAAVRHQLYFGNDFTDVNDGAGAADQGELTTTTFSAGMLRSSSTYFWRVDGIKLDGTVQPGPVWSFSTADGVAGKIVRQWWSGIGGTAVSALTGHVDYPNNPTGSELLDTFEGPINWADNYGSRLYGWLTAPQSGDYTFWIASDDLSELWLSSDADPANATVIARVGTYTSSRQWDKEAGQKSDAISLQAGRKYFIQALQKEGAGGDNIAVSWQGGSITAQTIIGAEFVDTFALASLQAFGPSPADGQDDAPQAPLLSWSAGEKARKHEVYFGDDQAAVAAADTSSPLFQGSQAGTSFDPGALEWGKAYYWRVDEVADGDLESRWIGRVWSFTTANFMTVEDFESYNDEENQGTRIYETWIDGWTTGNGATVGNWDPPFAEQVTVHGGRQSMPLDYNNLIAPFYSEAYREFAPVQNWTGHGVTDLSLWFRGNPVSFMDQGNGAFTISGSGHDIWDNADDFRFAYQRLSGNASITVKVESIVNTNNWAKAGVMIRESLAAGSRFAYAVATPAQGVSFGWRQTTDGTCGSVTQPGLTTPQWVKLTRTGDTFTAQYSADGTAWTDIKNADGTVASTTIAMTGSLYIGLCVTSHNAAATTTAEFSNTATTGGVTGAWQVAAIGDDPQLANSPQPLYVMVEDSTGKRVAVTNPDAGTANVTVWTEWKIPLSSFTGVSLTRVERLYIGIGDKNPDGTGRIYIDDIRVTK